MPAKQRLVCCYSARSQTSCSSSDLTSTTNRPSSEEINVCGAADDPSEQSSPKQHEQNSTSTVFDHGGSSSNPEVQSEGVSQSADGAGDAHEPHQRRGRDELPVGSREFVYLYIQTELCRKESLREWLATNKANRERLECIEIFKQVLMQFFGAVVELGRCGSVAAVQF